MRNRSGFLVAGGIAVALLQACASEDGSERRASTRTTSAALIGGDATVATFDTTLPARATGRIDRAGGGGCTATAISRNVVLFAAHCLCRDIYVGGSISGTSLGANWTFHLPYMKGGVAVEPTMNPAVDAPPFSPGAGIVGKGIVDYWVHPDKCNPDKDSRPLSAARYDLAIMVLARPLSTTELPAPLDVYTAGDLVDRIFNFSKDPDYDWTFWQPPVNVMGFAGTNIKRFGSLLSDQHLEFKSDGGPYYIKIKQGDSADTSIESGDSGSAVTFMRSGTTPTAFGVAATLLDYPSGDDYVLFSPTWDNGGGNGGFVRKYLEDGDHDGVFDGVDNCPPSRCTYPDACANTNQADNDGDGIGDACDNCAPARCATQRLPASACNNASQLDTDHDGVGDVCDTCADDHDSGQFDADGDGVGACDNCTYAKNGFLACNVDTDCVERRASGIPTGVTARCILPEGTNPRVYGKCADGTACVDDATCSSGACDKSILYGHCSKQLDDIDHDHVGATCDSCPAVANADVQANSNPSREGNLAVAAMGDRCDPVPVYVTRPVIATSVGLAKTVTRLTGSAGIGSATDAPSRSFNASVAFRHCDCLTSTGAVLDDVACRASGNCSTDPRTLVTDSWTPITIGSSPSTAPAAGADLARTFQDTVDCSDTLLHPVPLDGYPNPEGATNEPCRVGNVESLYWFHDADVKAGRVRSIGTGVAGPETFGLISSQVLVDLSATGPDGIIAPNYASARDRNSRGELRFNFTYVTTPLYNAALDKAPLALPADWFDRVGIFHPGGPGDPDPFHDPDGGPLAYVSDPVGLLSTPGGVFALSGADGRGLDVTSSLSGQLRSALATPGIAWLSAVEGARSGAAGARVAMVGVPTAWQQSFGAPLVALSGPSGLLFSYELGHQHLDDLQLLPNQSFALSFGAGSGLTTPFDAPVPVGPNGETGAWVPGDRTDTRALYSSTERSVFMIGGRRGNSPVGEVWQYRIDDGSWRRLFANSSALGGAAVTDVQVANRLGGQANVAGAGTVVREAPQVANVLGASYDALRGLLVVLDETTTSRITEDTRASKNGPNVTAPERRLVLLDRRSDAVRAIALRKKALGLSRFDVVARENGSFLVVAQRTGTNHWIGYRLELGPNGASWTTVARGNGIVVRGAWETPRGVVVPIAETGGLSFVRLGHDQCNGPALDHDGDEPDRD